MNYTTWTLLYVILVYMRIARVCGGHHGNLTIRILLLDLAREPSLVYGIDIWKPRCSQWCITDGVQLCLVTTGTISGSDIDATCMQERGVPIDFSAAYRSDAALVVTLRVDLPLTCPLNFLLRSGVHPSMAAEFHPVVRSLLSQPF